MKKRIVVSESNMTVIHVITLKINCRLTSLFPVYANFKVLSTFMPRFKVKKSTIVWQPNLWYCSPKLRETWSIIVFLNDRSIAILSPLVSRFYSVSGF